jgi:hypothetical protein
MKSKIRPKAENPNIEARNPKPARMIQTQMLQTDGSTGGSVSDIWISCFEFRALFSGTNF